MLYSMDDMVYLVVHLWHSGSIHMSVVGLAVSHVRPESCCDSAAARPAHVPGLSVRRAGSPLHRARRRQAALGQVRAKKGARAHQVLPIRVREEASWKHSRGKWQVMWLFRDNVLNNNVDVNPRLCAAFYGVKRVRRSVGPTEPRALQKNWACYSILES